jgi:hypothetical protein
MTVATRFTTADHLTTELTANSEPITVAVFGSDLVTVLTHADARLTLHTITSLTTSFLQVESGPSELETLLVSTVFKPALHSTAPDTPPPAPVVEPLSSVVAFVSATLAYRGEAMAANASLAAPVWRIRRITDAPVTELWAGGTQAFDKVWDNRELETYS